MRCLALRDTPTSLEEGDGLSMAKSILRVLLSLTAICALLGIVLELWTGFSIPQHLAGVLFPPHVTEDKHIALRIMPLGDSITEGYRSTDGNGYRLVLQKLLLSSGEKVNLVGTLSSGKDNENYHEGYGGARISAIAHNILSRDAVLMHPNVILLHAGTNDLQKPEPGQAIENAPRRLQLLLDIVLCENPDAVVLVAQIIQQAPCQDCVDKFNQEIPGLVAQNVEQGYKIQAVDLSSIGAPGEMADGLHPNDSGYSRMAHMWYKALREVPNDWFTPAPPPIDPKEPRTCQYDPQHWYDLLSDAE